MKRFSKTVNIFLITGILMALAFSGCKKSPDENMSMAGQSSEDVGGYYTCSMHPQVIEKEPGECPICGMKLVYVEGKAIGHKHDKDKDQQAPESEMYVCPMHPQVTSDKPGKCHICGMDLVKMDPHDHAETDKSSQNKNENLHFAVAPSVLTNANLLTIPVKHEKFSVRNNYSGNIDYNEDPDKLVIVNTKYEGWVESLYVSKEGMNIANGQLLMGVYSPSLLAAKEEYATTFMSMKGLYTSQGKSGQELSAALLADETVKAARQKLRYLDVSNSEISKIETEGKAGRLTYFYSPIGGTVIKKNVLQGEYIKAGQELLRIANLNYLWVYINVFEKDLAAIKKGQKAVLKSSAYRDREFTGTVDLIYPYLDPMTKDIKVRIVLQNSGGMLKPGMFTEVTLESSLPGMSLVIPDTAIIHSGDRNYVFVSEGSGGFELRPVQIKVSSDGKSVISKGLSHNELVVVNGQFLLDSEASLKEAVAKGKAGMEGHQH